MRGAYRIFFFDNIECIPPLVYYKEPRSESKVLDICSAVATQGFRVDDIILDAESAQMYVTDMNDQTSKRRVAHCSQFVYPIWLNFPKSVITIYYIDKSGHNMIRITAQGKDLELISTGILQFDDLADKVQFEKCN